jgi:hypothetical protein
MYDHASLLLILKIHSDTYLLCHPTHVDGKLTPRIPAGGILSRAAFYRNDWTAFHA